MQNIIFTTHVLAKARRRFGYVDEEAQQFLAEEFRHASIIDRDATTQTWESDAACIVTTYRDEGIVFVTCYPPSRRSRDRLKRRQALIRERKIQRVPRNPLYWLRLIDDIQRDEGYSA